MPAADPDSVMHVCWCWRCRNHRKQAEEYEAKAVWYYLKGSDLANIAGNHYAWLAKKERSKMPASHRPDPDDCR